jgi:putative transposase
LAESGKKPGKRALEEVAKVAKPDTMLGWYRKLAAQKFDGSHQRKLLGCPRVAKELEALMVQVAKDNRAWGYDRIAGALVHLGIAGYANILHSHRSAGCSHCLSLPSCLLA